jgi:F-type H+-transporting ATPase subunit gamma
MASKKELLNRIKSVKSTKKITKAMKMLAAAKLRKVRIKADKATPYALESERILMNMVNEARDLDGKFIPYLVENGSVKTHLLIVPASNRGLCGSFNSSIIKFAIKTIEKNIADGIDIKLITVGKRAHELLKDKFGNRIMQSIIFDTKVGVTYEKVSKIGSKISELLNQRQFEVCSIIYYKFKNAMSQELKMRQLIPFEPLESPKERIEYLYEPSVQEVLVDLLPKNLVCQLYQALIDNEASENSARMTAMENASKNAGEVVEALTMQYNNTRQAAITKELMEIISGSEAL